MKCIICDSQEQVLVASKGRFAVPARNVICPCCGLVYIDPQPEAKELEDYYDKEYRKSYQRRDPQNPKMLSRRELLVKFMSNYLKEDMSILEIGCADGALLHDAGLAAKTNKLKGVEINSDLAKKAEEAYGLDVFSGCFEAYDAKDKKFDLVIMQHVLEHCVSPFDVLLKIRELLNEDGALVLEVPDARAPYGDFEDNFLQLPHLFTFSRKTLKLLLKRAGFTVDKDSFGGLGLVAKKGKLHAVEDLDCLNEGESYQALLHFFKVYDRWYKALNAQEKNEKELNRELLIKDDLFLSQKMCSMHAEAVKENVSKLLDLGDFKKLQKTLVLFETEQPSGLVENTELFLLMRYAAKKNNNYELYDYCNKKIKAIKSLITSYEEMQ